MNFTVYQDPATVLNVSETCDILIEHAEETAIEAELGPSAFFFLFLPIFAFFSRQKSAIWRNLISFIVLHYSEMKTSPHPPFLCLIILSNNYGINISH